MPTPGLALPETATRRRALQKCFVSHAVAREVDHPLNHPDIVALGHDDTIEHSTNHATKTLHADTIFPNPARAAAGLHPMPLAERSGGRLTRGVWPYHCVHPDPTFKSAMDRTLVSDLGQPGSLLDREVTHQFDLPVDNGDGTR